MQSEVVFYFKLLSGRENRTLGIHLAKFCQESN